MCLFAFMVSHTKLKKGTTFTSRSMVSNQTPPTSRQTCTGHFRTWLVTNCKLDTSRRAKRPSAFPTNTFSCSLMTIACPTRSTARSIEVLRTGYFPDISVWPAAMFEGSNVQWRLRKSAFRIAVQLRRQLYSKLFAYYKRTNTCVQIC